MKKILFTLLLFVGLTILPFSLVHAEEKYETLNFKETLAAEEMEEEYPDYKETDDQITIYLFRGQGCGYCRAFLTFLNSIASEYGKYFKLESYEVWHNEDNALLMSEVSEFLDEPAGGVPYIVIGDKVFAGYTSSYDKDIKAAIKNLYDTKENKRYDVFKEMNKFHLNLSSETITILSVLLIVGVATVINVMHTNLKFKELNTKIDNINKNRYQKQEYTERKDVPDKNRTKQHNNKKYNNKKERNNEK